MTLVGAGSPTTARTKMNVDWLKPGKRRLKRHFSISQPLNFTHIQHVGQDDALANAKKISNSFQDIAEMCKALTAAPSAPKEKSRESAVSSSSSSSSTALGRALPIIPSISITREGNLLNEIVNSLTPELKDFLTKDLPVTGCGGLGGMGCATSKEKETSLETICPTIAEDIPDKPVRRHKTLRKVSKSQPDHADLVADLKPSPTKQQHLAVDSCYVANDKENQPANLPPPITPRTAKKLKLKDDMFKEMISKYCSKENPSLRLKELRKLGQGSSGVVMLVLDIHTEVQYALKKMNFHRQQRRDLLVNEVSIGSLLHPSIIQTYSTHMVGDELWVLMEPMNAGSLTSIVENLHIAQLTEALIGRILHGTVAALNYLHSLGVVHRDVKSDSILLSTCGQVKLSDFGYCDRITEDKPTCSGLIGTPHWMSPEIVLRKPYCPKTDIWSLGILVVEMLDGEPPNFSDSQIVAMERLKVNPPPSPRKAEISSSLLSFLNCCLRLEPELRSSARSLLDHKFFDEMATVEELANAVQLFQQNFKKSPLFTDFEK